MCLLSAPLPTLGAPTYRLYNFRNRRACTVRRPRAPFFIYSIVHVSCFDATLQCTSSTPRAGHALRKVFARLAFLTCALLRVRVSLAQVHTLHARCIERDHVKAVRRWRLADDFPLGFPYPNRYRCTRGSTRAFPPPPPRSFQGGRRRGGGLFTAFREQCFLWHRVGKILFIHRLSLMSGN